MTEYPFSQEKTESKLIETFAVIWYRKGENRRYLHTGVEYL